ncbi:nucleoside recognition domain-containing protein [Desulfospira joergensenii]|uniref:nucleoside recognition domain-containing protein n=1 Tax=Desulfospira joergensenii TaxID=53329 RepID=UPI0003B7061A|nr:nucleoside recognition domain-containing protein [Desulfospira joergensenii]
MINRYSGIRQSIRAGLKKGWSGLIWLLKILVPISFATALLVHFGIIYKLDFLLNPLMNLICLPASAALVLIAGLFTGIYGTVAALSVMPFSMDHMILMAVFTLISHNIIQESMVQGNSGINPFFAGFFRLVSAFIVTFACAKIMGVTPGTGAGISMAVPAGSGISFPAMIWKWSLTTLGLCLQIFLIIMPLMVMIELAKYFNVIAVVTRFFSPVLSVLGLDRSCGMLWMTAAVFGLAYGSAVIVEETNSTRYDPKDLTRLHLSIGINHAMIEDPALFLPLGIPPFWLWIPRLIAAMIAAWLFSAFSFAWSLYAKRTCHKKICDH